MGAGGVGPALSANEDLAAMDDAHIRGIIADGIDGTIMSAYAGTLTDAEIDGLVNLLRSWQDGGTAATGAEPTAAAAETATEPATEAAAAGGAEPDTAGLYTENCQGCHGEMGQDAAVGPSLYANPAIAAMADSAIYDTIKFGVEGTAMQSFGDRLSDSQIDAMVAMIQEWAEAELADATEEPEPTAAETPEDAGAAAEADLQAAVALYEAHCQACHGEGGKNGAVGPALFDNAGVADMTEGNIHDILVHGIEGSAMPAFGEQLAEDEMANLVALVTTWAEGTEVGAETGETGAAAPEAVDQEAARAIYDSTCQACHGAMGENGSVGPALAANADLAAMTDAEIKDIVVHGIEGTAMTAYGEKLDDAEINGLVHLLRSWQGE
jgi:mono/diheme cytochrome c family protein